MRKSILVIFLVILIVFISTNVIASNDLLIVELVIDTSGSMDYNDPSRLRETAANIFIDLLSPEDYLGIITFNSKVDMVIPIQQLLDDNVKNAYKEEMKIGLNVTGNTDYKAALDKANEELSKVYNPRARKVIIFLTDGEPDPDNIGDNPELMNSYMNEFWDNTISNLSKNNLPVYSIGFSDAIDVEVLERIAENTKGDFRIYKDAEDLDKNLIQLLKTREIITTQLLAPSYENNISVEPTIATDFWMKSEGYRSGEEVVISAYLSLGNIRMAGRSDLVIDSFQLQILYDDGTSTIIDLFDDGDSEHGDIMSRDGIFSNIIRFDKNGKGNASIKAVGQFKNEELSLEKPIGEFFVDNPGNILISSSVKDIWIKKKDNITVPLRLENQSSFKELVFIDVGSGFDTDIKQIELEPNEKFNMNLVVKHDNLDNGIHNLKLSFSPINNFTTLNNRELDISIEIVSFFDGLNRSLQERSMIIVPILIVFVGLPLFIFIFGMLLYLMIVKPQTKVKGVLTYWEEIDPQNKLELNLTKKRKSKIVISFDTSKEADYYIEGSRFKYDIVISNDLAKKSKAFILGWKALFTRNANIVQRFSCSQPGIIICEGDIYTNIIVNNDMEFSSGGFGFKYAKAKTRWNKGTDEGKNILEGRI